MRAVVYARLSRTRDTSASIEMQLASARAYAERHGWTVIECYADDGVSGTLPPEDRPQMGRLLANLSDVDVIVVHRLDRLARSLLAFADLLKRCEDAGVALASATEPLDTSSPMGRAMVSVLMTFAQLERDLIRERILDSKRHLADQGKHVSGKAPYGLQTAPAPDGRGRVLVRDPVAIEVLNEIIDRLLQGETGTAIAKDLNARGVPAPRVHTSRIPNPKRSAWSMAGIRKILEHPSVLGHRVDRRGHVIRGEDGKPVQFWDPVAPPEKIEAARRALAERRGVRTAPGATHSLYGVVLCGRCRRPLVLNRNSDRYGRTVLRCGTRFKDPCPGVVVMFDRICEYVDRTFLDLVGRMPAVERVFVPGTGQDVERELAEVEEALRILRDDREAGLFEDDAEDYRNRVRALLARRRVLRETPVVSSRWETRPLGVTFGELYEAADERGRGDLLRSIPVKVIVHPAGRRNIPIEERCEFILPEDGLLGVDD